jgi:hypothetical protein
MKKQMIMLLLFSLLSACKQPGIEIRILFDEVDGKIGIKTPVLWKGVAIGGVKAVDVSAKGLVATVLIQESNAKDIVYDSVFFFNREKEIEYHPLDAGSRVASAEDILRGTGSKLELMRLKAEAYLKEMGSKVKELKEGEVEDFLDSLGEILEDEKERFDEEVLPRLKDYSEQLKEKLKELRKPHKLPESESI